MDLEQQDAVERFHWFEIWKTDGRGAYWFLYCGLWHESDRFKKTPPGRFLNRGDAFKIVNSFIHKNNERIYIKKVTRKKKEQKEHSL